jgi:hypothetical protein
VTTTAHEDQYAPEPVSGDPVFETRADFYRWRLDTLGKRRTTAGKMSVFARIRRVTLAHLHLRDTNADSDGDDGA